MNVAVITAAILLAGNDSIIVAEDAPAAAMEVAIPAYAVESQTPFVIPPVRSYSPSMLLYYPAPRYGCYSHDLHRLHCHPGFHERHYRRPYNYRVMFDYPWHEDLYRTFHEAIPIDDCGEAVEPLPPAGPSLGRVEPPRPHARQARTPRRDLVAPDRTAFDSGTRFAPAGKTRLR